MDEETKKMRCWCWKINRVGFQIFKVQIRPQLYRKIIIVCKIICRKIIARRTENEILFGFPINRVEVEVEIKRNETYEISKLLGYSTRKFLVDKLRGRNGGTSVIPWLRRFS